MRCHIRNERHGSKRPVCWESSKKTAAVAAISSFVNNDLADSAGVKSTQRQPQTTKKGATSWNSFNPWATKTTPAKAFLF